MTAVVLRSWRVVEVDLDDDAPAYIRISGFPHSPKRLVLTFSGGKMTAYWNEQGSALGDIPDDMVQLKMPE